MKIMKGSANSGNRYEAKQGEMETALKKIKKLF